MRNLTWLFVAIFCCSVSTDNFATEIPTTDESTDTINLVVMDPLCDKLACDCVQGYAQRKYETLGEFLSRKIDRKVNILWGESIAAALEESDATADIVIGKHSVIESDAKTEKIQLHPIASLTGSDGGVNQTGLIVVRKADDATKVADLKDYRIFFGPADCDEKNKAPMALLRENGIDIPKQPEISGACSEAATKLMELDENIRAAAVISSYAEPLLAGCGTIEKGDLRIIGVSEEVPFVTAFVNGNLPLEIRKQIENALLSVAKQPELLKSLETKSGFVRFQKSASGKTPTPNTRTKKK